MASRLESKNLKIFQRKLEALHKGFGGHKGDELIKTIQGLLISGNREGLLAGTNKAGSPLAPLTSERKGPYRGATGPPLAPFGTQSTAIDNFLTVNTTEGDSRTIIAGWSGTSTRLKGNLKILEYHIRGVGRLPVRDIGGVRPNTWNDIKIAIRKFKAGFLK